MNIGITKMKNCSSNLNCLNYNCFYNHDITDSYLLNINNEIKTKIFKLHKFINSQNISFEELLNCSICYRNKYNCKKCKKLYNKYIILEKIISITMCNNNVDRYNAISILKQNKKYNKNLEDEHKLLQKYFDNNIFGSDHLDTIINLDKLKLLLQEKLKDDCNNLYNNIVTQFDELYTCPIERTQNIKLNFHKIDDNNQNNFNINLTQNNKIKYKKPVWNIKKKTNIKIINKPINKPINNKLINNKIDINNFDLNNIPLIHSDLLETLSDLNNDLEYYQNKQFKINEIQYFESLYYNTTVTDNNYLKFLENKTNSLYDISFNYLNNYNNEINICIDSINTNINKSIKILFNEYNDLKNTFEYHSLNKYNIIEKYKFFKYLLIYTDDIIESIKFFNYKINNLKNINSIKYYLNKNILLIVNIFNKFTYDIKNEIINQTLIHHHQ